MIVSRRSRNTKTGPVPTVSWGPDTCAPGCPFRPTPTDPGPCYAYQNGPGGSAPIIERAGRGSATDAELAALATGWRDGPPAVLRLGVTGDYFRTEPDGSIVPDHERIAACNALAAAMPGTVIIAYTHGWRALSPDLFTFTVRASCETAAELEEATAAGWAAVITDPGPEEPDTLIGATVAGLPVIECPQASGATATCETCRGLCGRRTRSIVAFPTHGSRARLATAVIRARRA